MFRLCSVARMGRVYLRTLHDCDHHGAILTITCGKCGRVVHCAPQSLIGLKVGRSSITRELGLPALERLLLCRGSNGVLGCGAKLAEVRAQWSHEIRGIPAGVSVIAWLNADERERKRLLRIARG